MEGDAWSRVKVADLIDSGALSVDDGYRVRNVELGPEGTPFIRGGDIGSNGTIETRVADHIRPEFRERVQRKIAKPNDVAFISKGTVGRVGILRAGQPAVVFSPQVCFWRSLDDGRLNPRFLYYLLLSHEFRANLDAVKTHGSMVADYVSLADQKTFLLTIPPVDVQKAIAHILGTLDDKIELNRRMNETLESMARALFKSWFVDFDPVIDNALAAGSSIPEPLAARASARAALGDQRKPLPENIRTLFPASFTFDEEMGWIPEGWESLPLDKIAHYQNGLALQKFRPENEDEFLPIVKIAQLKAGQATTDEKASPDIDKKCIIDDGDVVFSWSGSLMVDIWCGGKAALNQHLFKVTSDTYPRWFYHQLTMHHLTEFQRIAADKAVTMGHIKRKHLSSALCATPAFKLLDSCTEPISKITERSIQCRTDNFGLAKLRDTLLPKLLSGELRIPDAEKLVADSA